MLILVGRVVDPTASLAIDAGVGTAPAPPVLTSHGDLLARRPDVREEPRPGGAAAPSPRQPGAPGLP
ncbi:hypothetical protein ACRAWD_27555 [Caulobacter segnis]